MRSGGVSGPWAGAAPLDIGQADALADGGSHGLGQPPNLDAVVRAGGRHVQGQRTAGRVGCQVQPGAAFALGIAIACPRAAQRRELDPQHSPQILGQCLEAASRQPALRLLPNRDPGRGSFGIQRQGAAALIT
jgi:hypothetical protein